MVTERDTDADERLRTALERLTSIQSSVVGLNKEANQLKRHIKDFDINVDALTILANMRSKDQKDGGAQVLTDLTKYAVIAGLRSESHETNLPPAKPVAFTLPAAGKPESTLPRRAPAERIKLALQILAAVVITAGLFALIH